MILGCLPSRVGVRVIGCERLIGKSTGLSVATRFHGISIGRWRVTLVPVSVWIYFFECYLRAVATCERGRI